jgi:hypothetical protein
MLDKKPKNSGKADHKNICNMILRFKSGMSESFFLAKNGHGPHVKKVPHSSAAENQGNKVSHQPPPSMQA